MKCNKCGQREATREIHTNYFGREQHLFLCDECAKEYFPKMGSGFNLFGGLTGMSPMSVLSGINGLFDMPAERQAVCPQCRTTADEFIKTGFVGCPHCYEVFEPLVAQTVKKLQQSDRHVGKTPYDTGNIRSREAELRAELQAAVDKSDYDRIGKISEELKKLLGGREG